MRDITKPENCILGIALPITKKDFYDSLERSDFIRHAALSYSGDHDGLWKLEYENWANSVSNIAKEVERLGVRVIINFRLENLNLIASYDVFTLFTHSAEKGEKIEFYDGLYSCGEVVKNIPQNYEGLFDLSICYSTVLKKYIKKSFNNRVGANEDKATEARLIFYRGVIKYISRFNTDYESAYKKCLTLI